MKISKGQKNGLNYFIELRSYFNNLKSKFIQIEVDEFCETPDGTRCFEGALKSIVIIDDDEAPKYTGYCAQFDNEGIVAAINEHLTSLPE